MTHMKAAVIRQAGGPEVLRIEDVAIPAPQSGDVLIRVKAFGLNRSELFTRLGQSPSVKFPRILGIEAVGLVENAPGGEFRKGDIVAPPWAAWGGSSTGAEPPNIPACRRSKCSSLTPNSTGRPSVRSRKCCKRQLLFKSLVLQNGERVLIRGGTTSVGLAAAAIAKNHGALVATTTRKPDREGCCGRPAPTRSLSIPGRSPTRSRKCFPVASTRCSSLLALRHCKIYLRCARQHGIVCMTGMVGNKWCFEDFSPMGCDSDRYQPDDL